MDSNVLLLSLFLFTHLLFYPCTLRCHFPLFLCSTLGCSPQHQNHIPLSLLALLPPFLFYHPPLIYTGAVRASSIFPILSVILLFMGGLCIAASEFYKARHNIILSAGIFFVSAGE